jgi:molecular chaperone DnaK
MTVEMLFPSIKNDKTYIGIDFGTSTTVISIISDNTMKPETIEINQKLYDGVIVNSYKIHTIIAWDNNRFFFRRRC